MSSEQYLMGKIKEVLVYSVIEFKAKKLMQKSYISERYIKRLLDKKEYDEINQQFEEEYYENYVTVNDRIFEIYQVEEISEYETTIQKSGKEYIFKSSFYDGTTCLSTEIQEELKLMLDE